MRKTAILMLILAVGLGAASVFLARDWLRSQTPAPVAEKSEPDLKLTTIVVAKRTLNFGDTVTTEYLKQVNWPADNFPEGAFHTTDELISADKNRVALRAIQVNEPVMRSKVSGFGGKATLSTILDKEMRAVTIRVNDVNGVAGFVLPGDRVDVLLTRDESGANRSGANLITDILLQNQKVLGIDQKANDDEDKPIVARAVTLEVTPVDAQKLALASQVGSLSLALRNETDTDPTNTRRVRISDLKGQTYMVVQPKPVAVAAPAKAPAPKRRVVVAPKPKEPEWAKITIVRGVESSTENVQRDKNGNPIKGSKAEPAKEVDEEAADNGSKKTGSGAQDGPKLLVPQG